MLISKLYRQMYANTGIATDSARVQRSTRGRDGSLMPAAACSSAKPMPELAMPGTDPDELIARTLHLFITEITKVHTNSSF